MPSQSPSPNKILRAYFYKTSKGKEPVREWLKKMSPQDRKAIGTDIKTVEFGWPVGMPVCGNLKDGLKEVRTRLENRIARVIFIIDGENMILLYGFIKKTEKTPKSDLNLAKKRRKEL